MSNLDQTFTEVGGTDKTLPPMVVQRPQSGAYKSAADTAAKKTLNAAGTAEAGRLSRAIAGRQSRGQDTSKQEARLQKMETTQKNMGGRDVQVNGNVITKRETKQGQMTVLGIVDGVPTYLKIQATQQGSP